MYVTRYIGRCGDKRKVPTTRVQIYNCATVWVNEEKRKENECGSLRRFLLSIFKENEKLLIETVMEKTEGISHKGTKRDSIDNRFLLN